MKREPDVGRLRGKTRAGRLVLWDALLGRKWPGLAASGVLEVGAGERADTVLELMATVDAPLTVMELHPGRVRMLAAALAAQAESRRSVTICEGNALQPADKPAFGVVRCANVLRQYPKQAIRRAHSGLASRVWPGGVVLEGSCDAGGDVGAFHVLRVTPTAVRRESLVFFSSFQRGFAPIQLRDWLPRDLRKEVRSGGAMQAFFEGWTAAWRQVRGGQPAEDFRKAAHALGGEWVDLSGARAGAAAMIWTPPDGVPEPVVDGRDARASGNDGGRSDAAEGG